MGGLKTLFLDQMSEKHTLPNQSELREKKFLKKRPREKKGKESRKRQLFR
jgi:hypothetical protein